MARVRKVSIEEAQRLQVGHGGLGKPYMEALMGEIIRVERENNSYYGGPIDKLGRLRVGYYWAPAMLDFSIDKEESKYLKKLGKL